MKKGLKFGFVLLAALGVLTLGYKYNNTNAADYTITLTLSSGGNSSCTRANYTYTTGAAVTQKIVTQDNTLSCSLYATTTEKVKLKSSDLTQSSSIKIGSGNVSVTNSGLTVSDGFQTSYHQTVTNGVLNTQQTVFNKPANMIGTFTQKETIKITIPAGTPSGTYEGTLTVQISAS